MFVHPAVDVRVADLHPGLATLTRPAGPPDAAALAELAGRVAAAASLWRSATRTTDGPPWATRLLATDTVEVSLLGWAAGQGTRAHDHGGAVTALWVVEGELVEDSYTEPVWAPARMRRRLPAGSGATFPPGHVHVIANPGPGAAVAIQAASPPGRPLRHRAAGAVSLFADMLGTVYPGAG